MIYKKKYLYSIQNICIQWKIFLLYTFIFQFNRKLHEKIILNNPGDTRHI